MVDMSDPRNYAAVLAAPAGPPVEAPDNPPRGEPSTISVEVEPGPGREGEIGTADVLERFSGRADELGRAVGEIAERLRAVLEARLTSRQSDRWQMSQVSMEFGLNLEAETGLVVVKGKTAAAFKVAVTWTHHDSRPDGR